MPVKTGPASDPRDRVRLALQRWFGGQLPAGVDPAYIPQLDIGQLYADLTGDVNLTGRRNLAEARTRTGLASLDDTTFANAVNIVILQQWDIVAAAGYEWWKPIVHEQDFDLLWEIQWTTIGGFGNLSKNTPGADLNGITVTDIDTAEDTGDWTFAGDLLSVPIIGYDTINGAEAASYVLQGVIANHNGATALLGSVSKTVITETDATRGTSQPLPTT